MVVTYIVTIGEYSDYRIEGVFSTKELAEDFKGKIGESDIEEWKLDGRATDRISAYWSSVLDIRTGDLEPGSSGSLLVHPNARVDTVTYYSYSSTFHRKGCIVARSFVSQEHADKLCVERQQKIQRQGE